MKEIFGYQKLKVLFCEKLFQKKPPHVLLILLFQLGNEEQVVVKNENVYTVVNCKSQYMMK